MSTGSELKTLEHVTLKVPYEVLNKKFRATQKVLDREAAYVAQAGNEIEKLLADLPPISISPTVSTTAMDSPPSSQIVNTTTTLMANNPIIMDEDSEQEINSGDGLNLLAPSSESGLGDVIGLGGSGDSETMLLEDNISECNSNSNSNSVDKSSFESESNKQHGHHRGPKGKDVAKLLGALVDRLGSLKRKAGESIQDELEAARAVKQRTSHLKSVSSPTEVITPPLTYGKSTKDTKEKQWKRVRLNRMLVDHLLREGMYDTAKMLSEELTISELTNVEVFWAAKEVEESLQRHETGRMVAWCYENKSKLRKIKSTLELEIRVQEFVELVRSGKRGDAVKHARKYLADSEPEHIAAVKKCMGLLAFPISTTLTPYAELLSPDRWKHLVTHFRQEHARLYQLSSSSVLAAVVQAGLASLKTPQCYRPTTKNPNCPVCTDPLSTLANNLPFAHCAHSQLVCAISGEPLNENNPPLVLPSGFVYGTHSLQDMARTNGGKVICPRTSKVFSFSEADKVYVM
ncbi:E3 ubiquitin-protein transferase MAEA [Folsomia candida]|uniref:E3 ubiquitin-protein transferase MAEA n=1 Tax=Folsomia candida TaxID=158441 RepID=UPI000B8F962D|nr:E3 ubiquitin-protein transferase MAEA [Folsomia candida]